MIIQGSNNPLVVKFNTSVEGLPHLTVSMWTKPKDGQLLKLWWETDMTISGDTAICPLTEELTKRLPDAPVTILAKGWDENDETIFWDEKQVNVLNRNDRNITLNRTEG